MKDLKLLIKEFKEQLENLLIEADNDSEYYMTAKKEKEYDRVIGREEGLRQAYRLFIKTFGDKIK